jgi:hypothetical protein
VRLVIDILGGKPFSAATRSAGRLPRSAFFKRLIFSRFACASLRDLRLARIDGQEQVTLFHHLAFREVHLLQDAGHLGPHLDIRVGFDRAEAGDRHRRGPLLHRGHGHRNSGTALTPRSLCGLGRRAFLATTGESKLNGTTGKAEIRNQMNKSNPNE